jgi:hypothetical protein
MRKQKKNDIKPIFKILAFNSFHSLFKHQTESDKINFFFHNNNLNKKK